MAKRILSILAHPDDAEFLCAGTQVRLHKEHGYEVHIATMTAGDCGSATIGPNEISAIRTREGADAAAIISGKYHCLHERDLLVFYNELALTKVTNLIREVQPEIVLTHSPSDYMLDHEQTSKLARAACFCAPIPNFSSFGPATIPHIPHLYYCDPIEGLDPMGKEVEPQFLVDISLTLETKAQMLAAHASQREWLLKHHGMDQYVHAMREFSQKQGRKIGVKAAEGFRQHLGHSYPSDNLLGKLLGAR